MDVKQQIKDKCMKGEHNLRKIYRHYDAGEDVYVTIRYCDTCGAVVGDIDRDNRTYAGMAFTMLGNTLQKETIKGIRNGN